MSNVVEFESFKGQKELDEDFPIFVGYAEKCFGAKTDPEAMFQSFYYTLRYLEGHLRALWVFDMLGIDAEMSARGKKFLIDWLEGIVEELKENG